MISWRGIGDWRARIFTLFDLLWWVVRSLLRPCSVTWLAGLGSRRHRVNVVNNLNLLVLIELRLDRERSRTNMTWLGLVQNDSYVF